MNSDLRNGRTHTERAASASYLREFLPAIVGYVVVLVAILLFVDLETSGSWRYLVAVLPVVPALWGVRAISRHLRRVDEMQRSIQVDAMAAGFGVAMITALTIGFLAMAGLDANRWGPWLIYSSGMLGWLVAATSASRTR